MVRGYQVFPITSDTIQATVTSQIPLRERLIRAIDSGTITFSFSSGDKVIAVAGGEEFICAADCLTVTSTANVLMS